MKETRYDHAEMEELVTVTNDVEGSWLAPFRHSRGVKCSPGNIDQTSENPSKNLRCHHTLFTREESYMQHRNSSLKTQANKH